MKPIFANRFLFALSAAAISCVVPLFAGGTIVTNNTGISSASFTFLDNGTTGYTLVSQGSTNGGDGDANAYGNDARWATDVNANYAFTGLTPNAVYNLYGTWHNGGSVGMTTKIGSTVIGSVNQGVAPSPAGNGFTAYDDVNDTAAEVRNFQFIGTATADSSGNLTINVSKTSGYSYVRWDCLAVAPAPVATNYYWDGSTPTANGASEGGTGTWDAATANWDTGSSVAWTNSSLNKAVFGGTAGTVTLTVPSIAANQLTFSTTGYTLSAATSTINAPVAIVAGGTLTLDTSGTLSIPTAITGTGSTVVKTGTGTLTPSSTASTYGSLTINNGKVEAAKDTVPATATVTVSPGGIFSFTDATYANVPGVLNIIGGTVSMDGTIQNAHNYVGKTLTMEGGTLTSANGNDGGWGNFILNNSTLVVGGSTQSLISTATLQATNNGSFSVGDAVAGTDLLVSANINGGALTKSGAGTMELSATNSYSGNTAINAGTLKLAATGLIANTPAITVAPGAAFDVSAVTGYTLGSSQTLIAGDGSAAADVTGEITSLGTIRPGGTGTLGTISGITNLTLGGSLHLDTDRGSNNSDSLTINGTLTIFPGLLVTVNPTGTPTAGAKTYTIASGITSLVDAANLPVLPGYQWDTTTDPTKLLLKVTAANLVWNGATDTSWNFATMNWHNGTGASAFADGDYVSFDDTATGSGPVTVNMIIDASPGSVTVNNTRDYTIQRDSSATFAGIIGTTSVVKSGTGLLNLLSDNIHSGGTVISGGILAFDNGTLGTTGTITMDGGTLRWFGSNTQNISARLAMVAGKTATFDTNGNDVTFTSSIGSSTNASLAKMGTGTLTLQASNTYTGITTINGGTLKVANGTALGTTASGTTVNSSATLDLNGTNISGEAITLVGGALTNTAASDGFPGAVTVSTTGTVHAANGWIQLNSTSGTGSLVFTAGAAKGTYGNYSGTWAHTGGTILESGGIDLYSATTVTGGPVTINGGTLKSIAANRIGDNLAVTVNGGIWQLGGTDTIGSLAGSGGTVNLQGNTITTGDSSNTTYAGVITGTGGLVKQGSGTMTLSGANTYTGNTTVNAGMLDLSGSMKFALTNTSANRITGTGGVNLNGSFVIDTTAVTATTGSWTLVDVATLTENFGSFSIAGAGWSESANVWTKTDGTNVWTFTEATGTLTLAQSAGFTSWIAGFGLDAADQDPGDDPDHDGVSNLVEYALAGRSPALSDGAAGTFTNGVLSFSKRADTSGLTYQIQESDDLNQNDPWTVATATQDANTISYSLFPATGIKKFARLVVTMTP